MPSQRTRSTDARRRPLSSRLAMAAHGQPRPSVPARRSSHGRSGSREAAAPPPPPPLPPPRRAPPPRRRRLRPLVRVPNRRVLKREGAQAALRKAAQASSRTAHSGVRPWPSSGEKRREDEEEEAEKGGRFSPLPTVTYRLRNSANYRKRFSSSSGPSGRSASAASLRWRSWRRAKLRRSGGSTASG